MPMTIIITRNVADRYRGFFASIMPEVAPGVYVAPELSKGVRERLWAVVSKWWLVVQEGSILLLWKDEASPGRLGLLTLGLPPRELVDLDGCILVRRT